MITPIRIQRRYDHRLRELVRSTGDIEHAIRRGVPRSTARGWRNSAHFDVVTVDDADKNFLCLQQDVLALRKRVERLIAILRVLVVLLKVSGVSLANTRVPMKRGSARCFESSSARVPPSLCGSSSAFSSCLSPAIIRGNGRGSVASTTLSLVHESRLIS